MARADACLPLGLEAAGDKLSAKEVDEIIRQLRKRQRELRASETVVNDQDAALQAADQLGKERELAAVISKRDEAINLAARANLESYVATQWTDKRVAGLEARLIGHELNRPDSKDSIARDAQGMADTYVGGLINELQRAEVLEFFSSGVLDLEVRSAMRAINKPDALKKIDPNAVKIARISLDWMERGRINQNKVGAWIGKQSDYDGPQTHDMSKIMADEAGWKQFFRDNLDVARSFPDIESAAELDELLERAYDDFSTGVHLKTQPTVSGFKGHGNLAKKVSHERVYHFKTPEAAHEYSQRFGSGNLREAIRMSLQRSAQSTALMRVMGTNPQANLERVIDNLMRGADAAQRKELNDKKQWLVQAVLGQVDGTANIAVNPHWARIVANTMAVQGMAKLGGAIASSATDIPNYAAEMRHQGRGMLSGMAEAIEGIAKGKRDLETREQLASLGVFFESMSGEFVSRFSANDGATGMISKGQRLFFKANLLTPWTEGLDASAGIHTINWLARHADRDFNALPDDLRNLLPQYGIDAERWGLIRQGQVREVGGNKFLTPESLGDIPDDALRAYLTEKGQPVTGRAVENLRTDLGRQLRQYVSDRVDYAVIKPTARTRVFMYGESRPGSAMGTLRRLVWQFKAFPVTFVQRAWGREIYGKGAQSLKEAMRNRNGEMTGLANLIFWSTVFGYAAMSLKDLWKLKEPRNPLDLATIKAAFLQGGGLGIYGDFLLGETNRFGGSLLDTLAGPALGTISDIDRVRAAAMAGEDVSSKAFRVAVSNTPFMNLFYTRMVLDYMVLYRIQEHLNPGSLRRMERKIEKENNQTFIVPPSEVVN